MPASKYLKLPPCPHCGFPVTLCTVTTYTPAHDTIVRHRNCQSCNHSFWTTQPFEQPIDPTKTRVKLHSWNKKDADYKTARRSKVRLEPIE